MNNETPKDKLKAARISLYRALSNTKVSEETEHYILDAMSSMALAKFLVDKYYFDYRELSGFISAEYGIDNLKLFTEMCNAYRNIKKQ
jgi:hypothetical protein